MQKKTPLTIKSPVDTAKLRGVLSQFATGVTVITLRLPDNNFLGLTINSFNAVSLSPPLVLWSLGNQSSNFSTFDTCTDYVINVLADDQLPLANRFAQKNANQFDDLAYDLSSTGLPIFKGAAAWFECNNRSRYPEGDHTIFVGEVKNCAHLDKPALVFHNKKFFSSDVMPNIK